jgi:hypothetical protein
MTARGDEVVERVLALSRADGCVVLAEQSSGANLRWAGNTLTTNGETRSRSVTVISVVGQSVGVRQRDQLETLEDLVRASEPAARDASREDYGPLVEACRADFSAPRDGTWAAVFDGSPPTWARRVAARATARPLRLRHPLLSTTWLGPHRVCGCGNASRPGYVEMDRQGQAAAPLGRPAHRGMVDGRLGAGARRRAAGGGSAGRAHRLAARRSLRDAAAPHSWRTYGPRLLTAAAGAPGGPDRLRPPRRRDSGRRRLGPPGLRIERPGRPVLATPPSFCGGHVGVLGHEQRPSTTGCQLALDRLDSPRRGAHLAGADARLLRRQLTRPSRRTSTAWRWTPAARRRPTSLVASTGRGLLLTCLWYIREVDPQTLLLTGLTRDGVYLVEDGEVVGRSTTSGGTRARSAC